MTSLRRLRRMLAASAAAVLISAFAAGTVQAQSPTDTGQLVADKTAPNVLAQLQADGEAEFWVRFAGAPDYSAALAADTKADKGASAVEAAREFAETSQAGVVAALEGAGVEYESYWASSTIGVTGDADLLAMLASFEEVESIVDAPVYKLIEPVDSAVRPEATTWGVDNIGAPDVWDQGFDGTGVTVASIDTGVDFDHPALVDQYRGNNGDGTFTHDYNFYDVQDLCGDTPCDYHGHGTHTMGTMIGDNGAGAQIGVAPGAEWIAVNGCCPGLGALLESGQWIAAPTDSEGNDPDPSMAPEIVNNSWGTSAPMDDPFYEDIVALWHAAGIIPVFALGNNGPACDTGGSPGVYPDVIGVGAYDIDNVIADFSSRGPGRDGNFKPDLSAPGVNVVSALPGGSYGSFSGTSMAAPHAAGAIALMMSAQPALIGDYEAVYYGLTTTARPTLDAQCGGTRKLNNVYGHGRLDAFAAVMKSTTGDISDAEPASAGIAVPSAPRLASE